MAKRKNEEDEDSRTMPMKNTYDGHEVEADRLVSENNHVDDKEEEHGHNQYHKTDNQTSIRPLNNHKSNHERRTVLRNLHRKQKMELRSKTKGIGIKIASMEETLSSSSQVSNRHSVHFEDHEDCDDDDDVKEDDNHDDQSLHDSKVFKEATMEHASTRSTDAVPLNKNQDPNFQEKDDDDDDDRVEEIRSDVARTLARDQRFQERQSSNQRTMMVARLIELKHGTAT